MVKILAKANNSEEIRKLNVFKLGNFEKTNLCYISYSLFENEIEAYNYLKNIARDYYKNNQKLIDEYLSSRSLKIGNLTAEIITSI